MRISIRSLFGVAFVAASLGCQPRTASAPGTGPASASSAAVDTAALRADVAYLASEALEGRGTGTAGNDSAAAYIARRFRELRLEAPFAGGTCTAPPCARSFLQPFIARSMAAAHAGQPSELATQNVAAVIRGRDPSLRDEYVVIGAHFDHLGRSTVGALDPREGDAIRFGADDNASGTAAIMELARLITARPLRRSVIVAAFSGEEHGLLGSAHMVGDFPVPLTQVVAMFNFDMVGRLRNDRLIVYGVETAAELRDILTSANQPDPLDVRAIGDGLGPSDHASFSVRGIPVLHFFTDLHPEYHRATDRADLIEVGGMGRVVALAERVAREVGDRDARITPRPLAAQPQRAEGVSSTTGYGAYLGTIPDMAASETTGVRIMGVRPGSPADRGGMREGDVIVRFAGRDVADLYQYTDALRAHKPGETVQIVVLRAGTATTLTVTLERRGG